MAIANEKLLKMNQKRLSFSGDKDLISDMFSKLSYALQEEEDIEVMTNVLSWYSCYFRFVSIHVLSEHWDEVVDFIQMLLERRSLCKMQINNGESNGDCDVNEKGYNGVDEVGDTNGDLMESVGEVIVIMAYV